MAIKINDLTEVTSAEDDLDIMITDSDDNTTRTPLKTLNEVLVSIGKDNTTSGSPSNAVGTGNTASGDHSIAIGTDSAAKAEHSYAFGKNCVAVSGDSCAIGIDARASDGSAVAVGFGCTAGARWATAVGSALNEGGNSAEGYRAVAVGFNNNAKASDATAVGNCNTANATSAAMGHYNTTSAEKTTAIGCFNNANSLKSCAVGVTNTASGTESTSVGVGNTASGAHSTAVGCNNEATDGKDGYTTAIGDTNQATSERSTAIGHGNISSNYDTLAAGSGCTASGWRSVSVGSSAYATGTNSVAVGSDTRASGDNSVAIGACTAKDKAVAVGYGVQAVNTGELACGMYNDTSNTDTIFAVGNGTLSSRSNAFEVTKDGYVRMHSQDGAGFYIDVDTVNNVPYLHYLTSAGADARISIPDGAAIEKTIADKIAEVVADAPEDYDTLKEISDWISSHASDAAAMNTAITDNATAIETNKTNIATNASNIESLQTAVENKQDTLTFDSTPTENSTNPVTSGGVATALTKYAQYSDDTQTFTETDVIAHGYLCNIGSRVYAMLYLPLNHMLDPDTLENKTMVMQSLVGSMTTIFRGTTYYIDGYNIDFTDASTHVIDTSETVLKRTGAIIAITHNVADGTGKLSPVTPANALNGSTDSEGLTLDDTSMYGAPVTAHFSTVKYVIG